MRAVAVIAVTTAIAAMSLAAGQSVAREPRQASAVAGRAADWTLVEKTVREHFAAAGDFKPGDLITRDQVEAVLARLEKLGWKVEDAKALASKAPDADQWWVRQLRAPSGRQFMRASARYPSAYDRLERLSRLPDGRSILERLIAGPDGYKLVEYLATQPGGREMGRMLSQAPQGTDFNEPTGRLYTVDQLLAELAARHPQGPTAAAAGSARADR